MNANDRELLAKYFKHLDGAEAIHSLILMLNTIPSMYYLYLNNLVCVSRRHTSQQTYRTPQVIDAARLTTDLAKEASFNLLQHSTALEEIRVVDLFAGHWKYISGTSFRRGAAEAISVDQENKLYGYIKRTAKDI
ncbi:MAG: RsmD family RNA methyltransferase [Flavobacteriales bacterium]|nr:RsmD family RNA methyltransferase [Flavobacteriales bacterium]